MNYKEPSDCPWFYEPVDFQDLDKLDKEYQAQCNAADDMCSED